MSHEGKHQISRSETPASCLAARCAEARFAEKTEGRFSKSLSSPDLSLTEEEQEQD
jgi:hypothetical protein